MVSVNCVSDSLNSACNSPLPEHEVVVPIFLSTMVIIIQTPNKLLMNASVALLRLRLAMEALETAHAKYETALAGTAEVCDLPSEVVEAETCYIALRRERQQWWERLLLDRVPKKRLDNKEKETHNPNELNDDITTCQASETDPPPGYGSESE